MIAHRQAAESLIEGCYRDGKLELGSGYAAKLAVLDLIENPIHEEPIVRAHAIIFAGEGRADQWRQAGLPALGLLVDVSEDMETIRAWLATIPPMLVIVESADQQDRKKLLHSLEKDVRFGKTTIINSAARNAVEPVKAGNGVRTRMQSDI